MTTTFQSGSGDWTRYRSQFNLSKSDEIDLHFGRRDRSIPYDQAMAELTGIIEASVHKARHEGRSYVMFTHGSSTSRPGKTTARSQVRSFMRAKAATPLIERGKCIQHDSVFIAKLRPLALASEWKPDVDRSKGTPSMMSLEWDETRNPGKSRKTITVSRWDLSSPRRRGAH
jgi:hypothetical protein